MQRAEFGADFRGVGLVKVVEDRQRLLPGLTRRAGVACGVTGVAKAGEGVGFIAAVTDISEQI